MKQLAGTITQAERDEIQTLNYRQMTLQTLFRSLAEPDRVFNKVLYDAMMDDSVETNKNYDLWFRDKAKQYGWKSENGKSWSVDFSTCEVFLTDGA